MSSKHTSGLAYLLTWVALLILTGVSYAVSLVDLGSFGMPVALFVASIKVLLVISIFMHLRGGHFAIRMILGVSFAFVIILVLLMAGDITTRRTFPAGQEKPILPFFEEEGANSKNE